MSENEYGGMFHRNKNGRDWVVFLVSVKAGKILPISPVSGWRAGAITLKVCKIILSPPDWGPWSFANDCFKRITPTMFESCLFSWQNGST